MNIRRVMTVISNSDSSDRGQPRPITAITVISFENHRNHFNNHCNHRKFFSRTRKRFPVAILLAMMMVGLQPIQAAEKPVVKTEPFRYDDKGRRDPFVPLARDGRLVMPAGGQQQGVGAVPKLEGILYDPGGHSLALLDGTEAKVGDTVSGYQVVEIRKDAVVLGGGEEPVVLRISFETPPKAPAP